MNKQGTTNLLLGFALGANVILAAWIVTNHLRPLPVLGQTVDTGGKYTVATGRIGKGENDALYVVNHEDHKILVYYTQGEEFKLTHVRDFTKDLEASPHGKQTEIVDKRDKK